MSKLTENRKKAWIIDMKQSSLVTPEMKCTWGMKAKMKKVEENEFQNTRI